MLWSLPPATGATSWRACCRPISPAATLPWRAFCSPRGLKPDPAIAKLIDGIADPLPILSVKTDTYTTASLVNEVHTALWPDDAEKINLSIETFTQHVDLERLEKQISAVRMRGITPKMFTYNLLEQAKANPSNCATRSLRPRILKAAAILANKGIVKLILLGNRQDMQRVMDTNTRCNSI
jgi:phosphate acetyltransferase